MKDFLKIAVIVIAVLIIMVGSCVYYVYGAYKNFPDYAKEEVLFVEYGQYIDSIKEKVKESERTLSLAAKLEIIEHPTNLLYLGFDYEKDLGDKKNLDIIKNYESGSSKSTFTNGSTGYGHIGEFDIVIISLDVDKFDEGFDIVIYLKSENNREDKNE